MATLKDNPQRDSMGFVTESSGVEIHEPQSPLANPADEASLRPDASVVAVAHDAAPARSSWSRVQPWIVSGWLFGVALLSSRLLLGWLGVWRLRRRVEPVPEWLVERVRHLAPALRVTRPLIHLSHRVTEAVAVGFLKPMILLPVAWVTELPPAMIEAVIAHELAHIRRGDLWVNLVQRLIETLLFYHPAVWWLSRRLRIERELCCDELVVRTLHNPLQYAETLEHIGRLSLANTSGFAHQRLDARTTLTVSIGGPQNILLNRIRAILTPPQQDRSPSAWLAGLIPLVIACLVGWSLISRNTAPASDEPQPINALGATGSSSEPPVRSSRDEENTGGPKLPPVAPVVEPPAPSNDIRPDNLVEAAGTYRGRIVTEDGSPLPPDLKLMRRVSSEQTRETPVDPKSAFSFETDPGHGSVRFSMTATGFAPFDSSWIKLDQPLTLTLSRGAVVKLRLVPPAGSGPVAGSAALIVPWWDEDEQGTFPVDANGIVTIARCPKATVKIDVLVPGFEEVRVHRWVRGDVSLDVPLQPAKPTRLRIVSAKDGSPIAGAKVRLFSRTRAGSFLTPFQYWGDGPVWGESNADGRVELTTLRAVDPVPTNDPGAAIYAFRIDAPNHGPCYIGDVRAGSDLGEIQVGDSLEVRGEVVRDATKPERISLQIRQPTVAQGGKDGRGGWKNINLLEVEGKFTFHLTGLQAGPFDMFIVYSDASEPPNSPRGTIKQLQFHGLLTGSSSNLVVTRESVVPGDKLLTARRTSLFPIDDHPPSNVPGNVVKQLVAGWHTAEEAEGKTALQENKPTLQPLFVWSSTSPMQHSMGHVDWRVFVLQNGTVFVPGRQNYEAGTHHKLPAAELQELKTLLEKHRELFGKQVPKELPQFARRRHGHETLSYTRDGETKSFISWYGLEHVPVVGEYNTTGPHKEITDFISRLKTDAACGGREARAKYRELASQALTAALPQATPFRVTPFQESDWTNAVNGTDGTRTIRFADTDEKTEVTLIHTAFGEVYVERVEHLGKRLAFEVQLPVVRDKAAEDAGAINGADAKFDRQDARVVGRVVDARGTPVPKAVVLYPVGADLKTRKWRVARTEADERGEFTLVIPMDWLEGDRRLVRNTVWAWAKGHGIATVGIPVLGSEQSRQPIRLELPNTEPSEFLVQTETAKPVAGATVVAEVIRVPNGDDPVDGMFGLFDRVPEELKALTARVSDADGRVHLDVVPRKLLDSVRVITKSHGEQTFERLDKVLRLRPVVPVEGRLVGGPAENLGRVHLVFSSSAGDTSAEVEVETNAAGEFSIPTFPIGPYHVHSNLTGPWMLALPKALSLRVDRQDDIDLDVVRGIQMKGRLVVRGTDRGVRNARISIRSGDRQENQIAVTSDANGEYSAFVLAGERLTIQIYVLDFSEPLMYPSVGQPILVPQAAKEFVVPVISLEPAKIWKGKLIDENDKPIAGRYVVPFRGLDLASPARTDANGVFQLLLGAGVEPASWNIIWNWGEAKRETIPAETVSEKPLVLRVKRSTVEAKATQPKRDGQPSSGVREPADPAQPPPAGRPKPGEPLGPDQREVRIKPRGGKNATYSVSTWQTQETTPPLQRIQLSGGIDIEINDGNGRHLHLQADKANLATDLAESGFVGESKMPVTRPLQIELVGNATLEYVRQPGATPTKLKAERIRIDLVRQTVTADRCAISEQDAALTAAAVDLDLSTGTLRKGGLPNEEKTEPEEGDLRSEPRRGQETRTEQSSRAEPAEPKPGQTGHGVMLTVRGRVMIDGPIPVVPSLKIKPSFLAIIPRNTAESLKNKEREQTAPVVEIPDDSLVISKAGGIANVAIYLKKTPGDWKPSAPPSDLVVIEAAEHRFSPHMSFIRAGQSLTVKNSMNEVTNFHSHPMRGSQQNYLLKLQGESLIKSPYTQSESLPNRFASDIHPWMNGYLIALDHPFAAITDADGRFEIRDLPPGEHHFTVWHERLGYLDKDLTVRVKQDVVASFDLKYESEQFQDVETDIDITSVYAERQSRLNKHDQASVDALVGTWSFVLPSGETHGVVLSKIREIDSPNEPWLLNLGVSGRRVVVLGRYACTGNQLKLYESGRDKHDKTDFIWTKQDDGSFRLTEARVGNNKRYLGAKLIRTKVPVPNPVHPVKETRDERLQKNDREGAAKLVGRWVLTVSERHVYQAEIKQADDGLLLLTGVPKAGVLWGRFALIGERLELVEPNDQQIDEFIWQVRSLNKLSLVVSKANTGADYTGAKLERLAEAPKKDDEQNDRTGSAQSDSVFRIPVQAVEQAKRLAAEARSKRTSLKQRRPAGLEDLDSAEAIQRAAERAMKELADEKTNYPALLRLEYLGDAAFETLVAGTKSENPLVARSSCRALLHRGKQAVAPLCAVIDSAADLGVRSVAIETVGQTFDAEAVPSLVRALEVRELRVGAMSTLQYIRDPRAIEPLKKLVPIGGIGHAAEQAIKHIKSPQGYAWCPPESRDLLQHCHDAHTLKGETYSPDEVKRIIEGLTSDNSWIGYWCLSALGSLDSTEAVSAIIASPLSESKFQFLAGIGTPAALEHIVERLHSLNPQTQELAIQGLANGAGRWAAPLIIALLDDPSLTIPEKKDENDPLGLNVVGRNPLTDWPEWHKAHSALYGFFHRFDLPGRILNLAQGQRNNVPEEIERLKKWWSQHGQDFLEGKSVPNPDLTTVMFSS